MRVQRAWALTMLAFFLGDTGEEARASAAANEAIGVAGRIGDVARESGANAILAMYGGADGLHHADQAVALARRTDDLWVLALALVCRGEVARASGDEDLALALNLESLAAARRSGDRFNMTLGLANSSHLHLKRGDAAAAAAGLREAVVLHRELGNSWGLAYDLIGLGGVAAHQQDGAGAATILGAADAWFRRTGITVQYADRADRDRYVAGARTLTSPEAFTAAWEQGAAMELEDAIGYATERVGRTE